MSTASRGLSTGPALGTYVFLALNIIVPLWLFTETGAGANRALAATQIGVMIIAGIRYTWLLASKTRHLYEMIFWLFTYVFMGMAPYIQRRLETTPETTPAIAWESADSAALIVMVGCISVMGGSYFAQHAAKVSKTSAKRSVSYSRANILAVLSFSFAVYYISRVGFSNFLSSRSSLDRARSAIWPDSTINVMVSGGVSMSLLVAFIAQMHLRRQRKMQGYPAPTLLPLLLLATLLFAVNPISTPRYVFGTVALALLAALGVFATQRRYRIAALSAPVGLVAIFPFLDAYRYSTDPTGESEGLLEALTGGDFDAFAQIINTVTFVGAEGVAWGRQLLGVVLFWVPRSVWPDKPIDTGTVLADFKGYEFGNLSAPIWAELFINGGWFALVVGMFVLGYAFRVLDKKTENVLQTEGMPPVLSCIVPFYLLILLRGSLLAAMAYLTVVILCSAYVSTWSISKPIKDLASNLSFRRSRTAGQPRRTQSNGVI